MNQRLFNATALSIVLGLTACASPDAQKQASKSSGEKVDCVQREVATGSNMVRRVGCTTTNEREAEAARERLNAMPIRTAPEPGAR